MRRMVLAFCIGMTFNLCTSYAQTLVSGHVVGSWLPQGNPYIVIGDIIVTKDSALIIAPGVQVLFDGHYKFVVNGLLTAVGTQTDSILFTKNHPDSCWWGIRFIDANENSRLEYCRIEYGCAIGDSLDGAGGGIFCQNSSITISHNTIRYNSSYVDIPIWSGGAICGINSQPIIEYNIISNNSGYGGAGGGIFFIDSAPVISHNLIDSNTSEPAVSWTPSGGAIYLENSPAIIRNNLIVRNQGYTAAAIYTIAGEVTEFTNNTVTFNLATGSYPSAVAISTDFFRNNIVYFNKIGNDNQSQISVALASAVNYNDIEGLDFRYREGNFDFDPLFVDADNNDFHLLPNSPCIDAGDPASPFENEPDYNGKRINLGFDGNTATATPSSPRLAIAAIPIDFGRVYFGKSGTQNLIIKNLGQSRLNAIARIMHEGFSLASDGRLSILGGDSLRVEIRFAPEMTRIDSAELSIQTNDPEQSDIEVKLYGLGILGGEFFGKLQAKYSPFVVSESLTVPENQQLIIEPGSSIRADSGVVITIRGSLIAEGTPSDSIVFTSNLPSPFPGSWKGLQFRAATIFPESIIRYCRFSFAQHAIDTDRYPVDVSHSYFENCKGWGIIQQLSGRGPTQVRQNQFQNLYGAVSLANGPTTAPNEIMGNHIAKVVQGMRFGHSTVEVKDNVIVDAQSGIQDLFETRLDIINNRLHGVSRLGSAEYREVALSYLVNQPIEALNARYGITVNEGNLADAYLFNLGEIGDPNRDGVLGFNTPFESLTAIPKEGYTKKVSLLEYRAFVLKTRDGGYSKVQSFGGGGSGYGVLGFKYIYVPAGVDSFPNGSIFDLEPRLVNDGIVIVNRSRVKLIGNEITGFAGRGIACQSAIVDTFVHNRIFDNGSVGVVFDAPFNLLPQQSIFHAGTNPETFNEVYGNGEFNFVNGAQATIELPYFYWGTISSSEIAAKLLDGNDDSGLGKINFIPFLNESHDPVTTVRDFMPSIPHRLSLKEIYPNPFRNQARISFSIGKIAPVRISVYNLWGQEVRRLSSDTYEPGVYELAWDGMNNDGKTVASGIYIIELSSQAQRICRRVLFLH